MLMNDSPVKGRKKERRKYLPVYVFLFIILILMYGLCHSKVRISSDTTTILPMSEDFLHGNILLRGWILGTNNFYLTEIIPYAVGRLLGFSCSALINWVPGIAVAVTAVATLSLLNIDFRNKKRDIVFCALFLAVLLIVPKSSSYTVLNANSHNNLYAFTLLYIIWLKKYICRRNPVSFLGITLFGGILVFSESVASMVLVAPVAIFGIIRFSISRNKSYLLVSLSAVISFMIGKAIFFLFYLAGGMETVGFPIGIAALREIPSRLAGWVDQLGTLFGSYHLLDDGFSVCWVLVCIFIIFFFAKAAVIRRMTDSEMIFYSIAFINATACVFTAVPVFNRYIVPAFYFGSVLMLKSIADFIDGLESRRVYVISLCLVSVFCMYLGGRKLLDYSHTPDYGEEQKELVSFLQSENLTNGYADFWCASEISYYSGYELNILPIWINRDSGGIRPYTELIKRDQYSMDDVHFLITPADGSSAFVNDEDIFPLCGIPDRDETIGEYRVCIWEDDLSSKLNNGFNDGIITIYEMYCNENAERTDDSLILYSGGISYGPYDYLPKDRYIVTFTGDNLDVLSYDAYSNTCGEFSTDLIRQNWNVLEYSVDITMDTDDLEFRTYNNSDEAVSIYGAEVVPAA